MNQTSGVPAGTTLQMWQAHQRTDGRLVRALVIAATVPAVCFVLAPHPVTAWVMVIFLFALGMACLRLLNSTRMVIRSRSHLPSTVAAEIARSEILDVYEHAAASGEPYAQHTTAFWLASQANIARAKAQSNASPRPPGSGQGGRYRVRKPGLQ